MSFHASVQSVSAPDAVDNKKTAQRYGYALGQDDFKYRTKAADADTDIYQHHEYTEHQICSAGSAVAVVFLKTHNSSFFRIVKNSDIDFAYLTNTFARRFRIRDIIIGWPLSKRV